jgi:SP family facilitated glucose transporter-like MFS transporter 1
MVTENGHAEPEHEQKESTAADESPKVRRRSLYRQGSHHSQFGEGADDGIVLKPLGDGDGVRTPLHSTGSVGGGTGTRSRTPSGKSVRSRIASRAEYHHDLKIDIESKPTRNLLFASFLIMFGSSFLFGWNIGVLNNPVDLIRTFYNQTYSKRFGEPVSEHMLTFLWSLTTTIFIPGGMIGAFSAGFLADRIGRKRAILFSHLFAFIGAVMSCLCVIAGSPELLMAGRFFTGINCGFATQLAPMYLTEITPVNLRGAIGTGHQLFITLGILFGAVCGLREILGTTNGWPYLLLLNAVPAFVSLVFLPFIPESPRFLMLVRKKRIAAEKALRFFRQRLDIISDIEEMETELQEQDNDSCVKDEVEERYTMAKLLRTKDLRMPLLVAIMLQVIQQLSGINAIFFYSSGIYENAGVDKHNIQYAVVGTNAVNVLMTFIAVPVMDIAGRRKLLLGPMVVMNLTLVLITVAFNLQDKVPWMSYISVLCVILYVICFAVGLGPIPTMVGAELFRQGPRPMAMSLVGLANWLFTMVVAISFESVQKACTTYTFLIFFVLMVVFTVFVFFKVPETKGMTFEEIANQFQPGGDIEVEEVYDEDDVFGGGDTGQGDPASVPLRKNGSVSSIDRPEDKMSLTKSAENIMTVDA